MTNWLEGAGCFDVGSAARLCAAGVLSKEAAVPHQTNEEDVARRLGYRVSTGELSTDQAVEIVESLRAVNEEEALQIRVSSLRKPVSLSERASRRSEPGEQVGAIEAVLARLKPKGEAAVRRLKTTGRVPVVSERSQPGDWGQDAVLWDHCNFTPAEVEEWLTVAKCYQPESADSLRDAGITPQMAAHSYKYLGVTTTVAGHLCDGRIGLPAARSEIFRAAYADQVPAITREIVSLIDAVEATDQSNLNEIANLLFNDEPIHRSFAAGTAPEWSSAGFTADDFRAWAVEACCYHLEAAKSLRACGVTPEEAASITSRGNPVEYADQRATIGYKLSADLLPLHKALEAVAAMRHQRHLAAAWSDDAPKVEPVNPYALTPENAESGQNLQA